MKLRFVIIAFGPVKLKLTGAPTTCDVVGFTKNVLKDVLVGPDPEYPRVILAFISTRRCEVPTILLPNPPMSSDPDVAVAPSLRV
jgi:hypothetical protein